MCINNLYILGGYSYQIQLSLQFRKTDQRLRARHLLRIWTSNPSRTSSEIRQVSQNRKTVTICHTRSTVPQSRYRQMTTRGQNLRKVKQSGLTTPFLLFGSQRNDLRGISLTTNNNIIITNWLLGDKFQNYYRSSER